MNRKTMGCALCALVAAAAAGPQSSLVELLARMDEASNSFKAMRATVVYVEHTAVIDDNSEESGTVLMLKVAPNEVQGRIDFDSPADNKRIWTFAGRKAQEYIPKSKTLHVYDMGDKGDQIDQFLMLGFGTSSALLNRDYTMRVTGEETVQGQKTKTLEMTPKSAETRNLITKLELWIPDSPAPPYPVREKIYEKTPGDYRIATYTGLQINPKISADELKLKLPAGVKIISPQK